MTFLEEMELMRSMAIASYAHLILGIAVLYLDARVLRCRLLH